MRDNIYKQILMDSPIAYVSVKGIKNSKNEYTNLTIIEANQAFFNISSDIKNYTDSKEDIKDLFMKSLNNDNILIKLINKHFIYNSREDKIKFEIYDKLIEKNYDIDIYLLDNDIFWIKIAKVNMDRTRLSNVLNNSPFAAWIKDKEGKYIDVNKKFIENSGKRYSEIIGSTANNIWGREADEKYSLQDKYILENLEKMTYSEIVKFDGESKEKYYEITKWPYLDENENIIGTIGIILEIVDNIELRKNLKENEEKFKEIINYSEEGFFIIENEKLTYSSKAFDNIISKSEDSNLFDINSLCEYIKIENIENIEYDSKKPFDKTIKIIDMNNNEKWVWLKIVPIKDERGNVIKSIGIISDVSKKKEVELEIEEMRNEFFANLSHELRTPINLILGTMQLLDLKLDKLDYEDKYYLKKYNKIVTQNGLRLLKLVNNIIDTTKIDAGYFKYNPQNYDIIKFVEDICTSVCDFAKQQSINLIFDTELEENIMTFDLDMMERIILNLLSNAIKFNKENGNIDVYINTDNKGNLNISIKDSGIGIPKEKIDAIFSRFNQVNSKAKKEKEGSGIGLALVKSFIDLHDGEITVNSDLNKGSEFIISIPNILIESNIAYNISESDCESQINRMNVEFSDIYV